MPIVEIPPAVLLGDDETVRVADSINMLCQRLSGVRQEKAAGSRQSFQGRQPVALRATARCYEGIDSFDAAMTCIPEASHRTLIANHPGLNIKERSCSHRKSKTIFSVAGPVV